MPANKRYEPEGPKDWSPIPKKTYIVTVYEVHVQEHEVKAKDAEEAKAIVAEGGGEQIDGSFEFSHTQDTDTWRVTEKK